jgi:uncharacterized protein (TIGR02246 family)
VTERSADLEAIARLKARYFRAIDTKDWGLLGVVFTEDARIDVSEDGGGIVEGRDRIVESISAVLEDVVTVHHGHTPEIDLLAADEAAGVWAMDDRLVWPDGSSLRGAGHYHEQYRRVDGEWRIAAFRLTRLVLDHRPGPDGAPG